MLVIETGYLAVSAELLDRSSAAAGPFYGNGHLHIVGDVAFAERQNGEAGLRPGLHIGPHFQCGLEGRRKRELSALRFRPLCVLIHTVIVRDVATASQDDLRRRRATA